MKSRIIFENTEYSVNEQEKTVSCTCICSIDLTTFNFWKFMNKFEASEYDEQAYGYVFACRRLDKVLAKYMIDNGFITFEVVGVAKCNDSDVFDEALGRHIANTRAQEKAEREAAVIYNDILEAITRSITDELFDTVYNCMNNGYSISRHENDLLGIENDEDNNFNFNCYTADKFKRVFA